MTAPIKPTTPPVRHHGQIADKKKKEEGMQVDEAIRTTKRKADGPLPKAKIRLPEKGVQEYLRQDAYTLSIGEKQKFVMDCLSELDEDAMEKLEAKMKDVEDLSDDLPLKRSQKRIVEQVGSARSKKAAMQLYDLYQILEKSRLADKPEGQKILQFAQTAISRIPERMDPESGEVDEDFINTTRSVLSGFVPDLTEESVKKYAALAKANMDNPEKSREHQEAEDSACQQMGTLLLACQYYLREVSEICSYESFDDALVAIGDLSADVIEQAQDRILEHRKLHLATAIQDHEEAAFDKMALEMANLLLLDDGGINFGLVEILVETLIPEPYQETRAVQNLLLVLAELYDSIEIGDLIEKVRPPKSKESPSDQAIRAVFNLKPGDEITKRHAQLLVLSALLGHLRQAKAGTCFTTGWLIQALYTHLPIVVEDLAEAVETGAVTRTIMGEQRQFPFQAITSVDGLNNTLKINQSGKILSTSHYEESPDGLNALPKPHPEAHLWDSPGIRSVCASMGLDNPKEAILQAIQNLPSELMVRDLIASIAQVAHGLQENSPYFLRSQERLTVEEYAKRGRYAFCSQTNPPLHRAYEATAASMVNYFGSSYFMPNWIYEDLKLVLKGKDKGYSTAFQAKYKRLMKEIQLPLITRIRFRYNHSYEDTKPLFDDSKDIVKGSHWYGYELCDAGLPEDFEYSTVLCREIEQASSSITPARFEKYPKPHQWRTIGSEAEFQDFLKDLVKETVDHIISEDDKKNAALWKEVEEKMCKELSTKRFTEEMIFYLLGKDSDQKKKYRENPHSIETTPWKFRWGGDFNKVLKTYFGLQKSPSKLKPFNGTQREVLAKWINFLKNQNEDHQEALKEPRSMMTISSPVHVFPLTPKEPSFLRAWQSDMPAHEYIDKHVIAPGKRFSEQRTGRRLRLTLIETVANNSWVSPYLQKEGLERQELTEHSKHVFDRKIGETPQLFQMSGEQFVKELNKLTALARAEDPAIGQRCAPWEQKCLRAVTKKMHALIPAGKRTSGISRKAAETLIDFARNRSDSRSLSESASKRFRALMEQVPQGLSIKDLRGKIVKAACKAREDDLYRKDDSWKEALEGELDNRIFASFSEEERKKLIATGIVTHDTNWKSSIHDFMMIFLVNPGTGKLEMCRYLPDTSRIEALEQASWFPQKKDGHGYWQIPDNFRVWDGEPLFKPTKMFDM